jgi:hypothetical protein
MGSRPYDAVARDGGSLVFEADLPAFAPIGRRYAEVEDARLDFSYTREYIDGWTAYVDAVQQATAEALAGRRPWPEIVAEMSRRYPEEFPRSLDRVPTYMLRSRETTEGLKTYLEWLAQNARLLLMSKLLYAPGDLKTGPGNKAYAANVRKKRAGLLPAGRYRFDCRDRSEPTAHQKALFDRLESGQTAIFQGVADALRAFYGQQADQTDRTDLYEQVIFPADDSGDVPLDRFRIRSFLLHPSADRIGLTFDAMFDWCDEHGCAVVASIGGGEEPVCGGWDVLETFGDDPMDGESEDFEST